VILGVPVEVLKQSWVAVWRVSDASDGKNSDMSPQCQFSKNPDMSAKQGSGFKA
tara:strand:- start:2007 stop:2168 length:162 start_codon:yes stop_codon:yes gene_type:complete